MNAQKEELIEQKNKIEIQNSHIHSSIHYAKTIQEAILPLKEKMDQHFSSFILFKPRDVVSGDFYWFSYIPKSNYHPAYSFVAVVDCTGHGVPGAFMSMIGSRLLNAIVNENHEYDPKNILTDLDKRVKHALKQDKTDNNDGMDVCLVRIEDQNQRKERIVTFSGAKRPLFYYKHSTANLYQIKGSRKSIGGVRVYRNTEKFANHEIHLAVDDLMYLTTDGYIDQNNPKRNRFGTPRFTKIIERNADLSLARQQTALEFALSDFQMSAQQRDDMAIVGIRV